MPLPAVHGADPVRLPLPNEYGNTGTVGVKVVTMVELRVAVIGDTGDEDGPVDRGTVPLGPLMPAPPVRFPAGKEYEYGLGVYW